MQYKILNRKHSSYDENQYRELRDLYIGGFDILKHAKHYLPRVIGETDPRYAERIRHASYIPYFGEIVDYFVSNLFNQELTVTPPSDAENPETPGTFPDEKYYSKFYANADRAGTPFADIVKEAFRQGLIYKRGVICVDYPNKENSASSLADEEELGLADAYAYHVAAEDLINWKYDDYGNIEWCIIKCTEEDTSDPLSETIVLEDEFKVWRMVNGFATWQKFSIKYTPDKPPTEQDEVSEVDSGDTTFKNIPVIILDIPDGLWVGNKIGPLAKEHFRRRSMLNSAESKSLVAIPVAALGPEVGAFQGTLPSEAQTDPHRGDDPVGKFYRDGYVVTGSEDKLYYFEPSGTSYQIVDRELQELRDEMFRVVHQMAQGVTTSSGGATRRSGLSKVKDAEATVIILGEYGRLVRKFGEKIYRTISESRRENVSWIARGLDTFEVDQRTQIIDEATKIDLINIPSRTFKTEYKTLLAFQILGNSHSKVQQAIREEIREGVEYEQDLFAEMTNKGLIVPAPGMPSAAPPGGGSSGETKQSAAQTAENISRGMAGMVPGTKKNKAKQNLPQPRQAGGKFGNKPRIS